MATGVTVKDKRANWDAMQKELKALAGRTHVVVGLTNQANGEVIRYGSANEFGYTTKAGEQRQVTTYKALKAGAEKASAFHRNGTKRSIYKKRGRFVKASKANFVQTHDYVTKAYTVPARPFMRAYYDNNLQNLGLFAEKQFLACIMQGRTVTAALNAIGLFAQDGIKAGMRNSANWTPNAPATVRAKGSDKPLIDKGILINSITFEIRK